MVLYKMMVILTYPACWDQQRQRRGPCPGEPLEETKISLRQLKSDHIHKEEVALSLKASNSTGPQTNPPEKGGNKVEGILFQWECSQSTHSPALSTELRRWGS